MAARPESRRFLETAKIRLLPPVEGVVHLLNEVAAGLPEPEVVFTEAGLADRHSSARFPLIATVTMSTPDHFVADVPLDPTRDPFLIQHRFRGRPMLPVVVAIEAFCQAVQKFVGEGRRVVRVGSVETVNGLRFFTDEVHAAHVHGRVRGNVIDCELTADFSNSKGKLVQADRVFLRGTVEVASAAKRLELHAPELPREWNDVHYADEDFVIYHGPIFRCLTQMKYVPPGTWVNFRAAPLAEFAGARGTSGWLLPDQLLDACFFACGVCLWFDSGFVSIPCNLDALTVVRCPRPDEACRAFIVQLPREGQHARFNFTLVDADNRALLQVEGFRTVIVNQGVESTPSGGLSG